MSDAWSTYGKVDGKEVPITLNPKLQTRVHAMSMIGIGRVRISMPEGSCADMGGAVALAVTFCPSVLYVETYAGSEVDTVYRRQSLTHKWEASYHEWRQYKNTVEVLE